ncbi:MAG: CHASE3 domain-containing protein, partial [Planctomycetes bacterium]|nr:CHASE3 domain-containing protein [Planctomycetota bacterium]
MLFVILGVMSTRSINSLNESSGWVDRTHTVIAEAEGILASGVDMETGMRGYLLAGQDQFLAPYIQSDKRFNEQVAVLKQTVNDNPAQVELLGEIQTTIAEWKAKVTEPTIALRRDIGDSKTMNDMAKLVGDAKGKVYFVGFRQQIATFAGREEVLMAERKKTAMEATATATSSLETVTQTTQWVTHTYEVIAEAKQILAAAVDMETGMRGYLLAGEDEFLDPYNQGKQQFFEELAKLSQTVNDNPAQVTLLEQIRVNIEEWNEKWTEPAIALRREVGNGKTMDDVVSLIGNAGGKKYFDRFRGQIATFVQREADLLGKRREEGNVAAVSVADSIKTIGETTKWVDHTHEVIAEANAILASAVDMETGMRGYLLAGRDEFLDPYTHGQKEFAEKVAALQKTVDDNPAQVQLLGQARATINEWQEKVTEPTIALRREIGDSKTMDDMADLVAEARGKVYFDKFREQISTFTSREQALMTQRQEDAAATAANTKMVIVAGTTTAILLALIISALLTRAVVGPFKRIFAGLKKLSAGELGQTEQTFNRIIDGMTENVAQVADGAAQISFSSQHLAAVS